MTSKVYFMDFRSNEDENLTIDQASLDLMNREPGLPGTALKTNMKLGEDKIRGVYSYSKHEIQLEYAQEIGIGSRDYELIKI